MKNKLVKMMAIGMAVATVAGGAMPVFAAGTPTATDAALDAKTELYTTTDAAGKGAWGAGTSTSGDGQIDLTYDTTNGQWKDSVDVDHDNGTYVVRIPTAIKYENMHIGKVSTSNDYNVTVEGVLASGKTVKVSAETGKAVAFNGTAANADAKITEATTMIGTDTKNKAGAYSDTNFRTFSAEQVSVMNDDGKVSGTTVQDNIAMSGKAYSAGTYTGTVQYSSALVDA